jgi:hypothetical protein
VTAQLQLINIIIIITLLLKRNSVRDFIATELSDFSGIKRNIQISAILSKYQSVNGSISNCNEQKQLCFFVVKNRNRLLVLRLP